MRPTASSSSALSLGAAGLLLSAGLAAQAPFGPTQFVWTASNGGDGAFEARSADLDGDGDLDLVCCNNDVAAYLPELVWFENDGAGNFGAPTTIHQWPSGGPGGVGCDVGDFDGDGDVDAILAFGSTSGPALGWLANDGAGNFGALQVVSTAANTIRSLSVADLDGDGDLDALLASSSDGKISWHANDGAGNFGPQQVLNTNLSSSTGAYEAIAADTDGDGDLDVLAGFYYAAEIVLWTNDGAGNFGPPQVVSTEADYIWRICAADFDCDGDLDLATATDSPAHEVAWYANDGAGNFGAKQVITSNVWGVRSVWPADLDGDGDIDIVQKAYTPYFPYLGFWGRVSWFPNDGAGNFDTAPYQPGFGTGINQGYVLNYSTGVYGPGNAQAADLDGDGDLDVFSAADQNGVTWYENLSPAPSEVLGVGCAGLDLSGNAMQLDTSWDLRLCNVSSASPFSFFFVGGGALPAGVPLNASCSVYTTAELGTYLQPAAAGTSVWSLPVPNDPSLIGAQLTVQGTAGSADPTAWNGIALSNGLRGTVGQ